MGAIMKSREIVKSAKTLNAQFNLNEIFHTRTDFWNNENIKSETIGSFFVNLRNFHAWLYLRPNVEKEKWKCFKNSSTLSLEPLCSKILKDRTLTLWGRLINLNMFLWQFAELSYMWISSHWENNRHFQDISLAASHCVITPYKEFCPFDAQMVEVERLYQNGMFIEIIVSQSLQ